MAWAFMTILALAFLFVACLLKPKARAKKLPPGPTGLPLIGSLHLLGKHPHRDLHRLAQKYGPIMHLKLGLVPTIVISSPRAAELFLKDNDLIFADRPPHEAAKHISYGQKNLTFAPYGSYWRDMRKLCTLELLSNLKINSFRWMRKEELDLLIQSIKEASQRQGVVNLSEKVASLSANMSCRMVFGKKYEGKDIDERGFKGLIQEGMHLFATPNIGDYIPHLSRLDLQGLTKKMKIINKKTDDFIEMIIDEHVEIRRSSTGDMGRGQDFVDVMLEIMGSKKAEYPLERDNIKAITLDMFVSALDTSSTTIEWAFSELIRHPMMMEKVKKELEDVVGLERMVEESDLEKLNYLEMVVKETQRLHAVVPLLLPHASMEDCNVDGFNIPKKSRVLVNAWAIGRDPLAWPKAEKFWPERFEGSQVDVHGRYFELLPFGSGRRRCPGMQLGLTVVRLVLAQLVHCFDWELPDGMLPSELDMTEEFGLVISRANHLHAIPSYRLNM